MSDDAQCPAGETRSATIFRHTRAMQRATGCSMQTFSARVIEHYHAHVPEHMREIVFKVGGDVFRDAQTNAQHLSRFMDPDTATRLPVDLEESWVAALGGEFLADCRRDLARRYGLLDVPVMESDCDVAALGNLTRELGEVLKAIGPTLDDGRFTAADIKFLPAIERELDDLCGAAVAMKNRVVRARRAAAATRKKR
jgi:hypothetical protein